MVEHYKGLMVATSEDSLQAKSLVRRGLRIGIEVELGVVAARRSCSFCCSKVRDSKEARQGSLEKCGERFRTRGRTRRALQRVVL
jgi:aminoglycoside N3'-acetyltransferase